MSEDLQGLLEKINREGVEKAEAKAAEIFDLCMKNGVNYYDTAWFYHQGKSEELTGRLLSKYPRDRPVNDDRTNKRKICMFSSFRRFYR